MPLLFDELARCRPWIEGAMARGEPTHTWDDVIASVYSGRMQFWPHESGAVITEIQQYPRRRYLNVIWAGGDMAAMRELEFDIIGFAQDRDCVAMRCTGRKGWARALPGWTEVPLYISGKALT